MLSLADVNEWVEGSEGGDPLVGHREKASSCAPAGVIQENLTLEVDTGLCPYAFFVQPLRADLEPGDHVEVTLWHNDLVALDPAMGHAALLIDGAMLWEREIEIPGSPCAYVDVVEVTTAHAPGAELQFHLHNHGANTWNLFEVKRLATGAGEVVSPSCP